MNDKYLRRGIFEADVVFRGKQLGNMPISGSKEDFQLVPKEEEKYFLEKTLELGKTWTDSKKVPRFVELPPLMKQQLASELAQKTLTFTEKDLKMPFSVKQDKFSNIEYE